MTIDCSSAALAQLASNKVLLLYDPYKLVQASLPRSSSSPSRQRSGRETVRKTCHLSAVCWKTLTTTWTGWMVTTTIIVVKLWTRKPVPGTHLEVLLLSRRGRPRRHKVIQLERVYIPVHLQFGSAMPTQRRGQRWWVVPPLHSGKNGPKTETYSWGWMRFSKTLSWNRMVIILFIYWLFPRQWVHRNVEQARDSFFPPYSVITYFAKDRPNHTSFKNSYLALAGPLRVLSTLGAHRVSILTVL